jgi:hypothetical protein
MTDRNQEPQNAYTQNAYTQNTYTQNTYDDSRQNNQNTYRQNVYEEGPNDTDEPQENPQDRYRLKAQDEEQPMDLGTLQDIFSFRFIEGRPITNIILAILWSIGLPILLYQLLKPHLGQVLAMIVASAPPLIIVIS